MYHLQMTYDFKFTFLWERTSIRWLLRMRALQRQLQSFTEMIQRRFSWSSYDLRPNIIPAWVKCVRFSPCHNQDFTKRPGDFQRFPTNYRRLPNVAESWMSSDVLEDLTLEHFRSYLKDDTFSVLWYDFVRTQKRTQSSCVKNNLSGFESQMWEIVLDARDRTCSTPRFHADMEEPCYYFFSH